MTFQGARQFFSRNRFGEIGSLNLRATPIRAIRKFMEFNEFGSFAASLSGK